MLVTLVDFPSILNDSLNSAFFEYLSRASVLSTILLKIPQGIDFNEKFTSTLQTIFLLGVTNAEGFRIDDDEIVSKLLDNGLQVAYFTYSVDMLAVEKELLKKVLKSLPRSRVGLSLNESSAATSTLMTETIHEFNDFASHFNFKCSSNFTNQEQQIILKTGKELINNSGFAIQICFEIPSNSALSTAVCFHLCNYIYLYCHTCILYMLHLLL